MTSKLNFSAVFKDCNFTSNQIMLRDIITTNPYQKCAVFGAFPEGSLKLLLYLL